MFADTKKFSQHLVYQGRRKQIKVGWDNFEACFLAKKVTKSKLCLEKLLVKGCRILFLGIVGAKVELKMASKCNIL